ncbi:succinylglutamate desuccinylase/aspartoacylase family protein [Geminicoccaceae bacterium 1502E]|nr:succinylglutamate desuccinylase/aspartoacylase family protein [Geminicoccaceae bacterium 1502E]
MSFDLARSRIKCPLDLESPGKRAGNLALKYSDNANPLGIYPVPIMAIVGGPGPTTLLVAGVHGDEFEGPVALIELFQQLDPARVRGRLLFLPALNAPAVRASSRVSPLDGANLNRAFPGDREGPPTAMLAHLVESVLMPGCDAVIDLHAGGKASFFTPCALAARTADGALSPANMALAEAFGAPAIWVLGRHNDDRSVNAAATRRNVPMIAAELGGNGAITPDILALAGRGLRRCLAHLGHLDEMPPADCVSPRVVEIADAGHSLHAPGHGLMEPLFVAGDWVREGQLLGRLYSLDDPARPPVGIHAPTAGLVLAAGARGHVEHGDFVALLATELAG